MLTFNDLWAQHNGLIHGASKVIARIVDEDGDVDEAKVKACVIGLGSAADAAVRLVARPYYKPNAFGWANATAASYESWGSVIAKAYKKAGIPAGAYIKKLFQQPQVSVGVYTKIVAKYLHKIDSRTHVPRATRRGNGGTYANLK